MHFLAQLLEILNKGEVLLDLVSTSADELIKEVKIGCSLGCSSHYLVEFVVLGPGKE